MANTYVFYNRKKKTWATVNLEGSKLVETDIFCDAALYDGYKTISWAKEVEDFDFTGYEIRKVTME